MPVFLFFPSPATIPPSAGAQPTGQESFLSSYWSLDNVDIGSVLDGIGLNDGTNVNALTGEVGQVNQAYEFDGYSSYLSFPSDLSFESHIGGGGGFSFSCWVNPTTVAVTQTLLSKFDTTNDERAFRFQLHADGYTQLEVSDRTGANCVTVCSSLAIPAGQWSQIGFIYNNREIANTDKITLFINSFIDIGQVVGSSGAFIEMGATDTSLILGAENPDSLTNFYTGLMDEILIWCGAINPIKMAGAYADGYDGYRFVESLPDPTSYWTLDDADLSGTTVLDVIGSNDGINIGAATTGVAGVVNEAFDFDGTADRIDFGDVLGQASDSFSLAASFKWGGKVGTNSIIRKGISALGTPANAGYLLWADGTNEVLCMEIDDGTGIIRTDSTSILVQDTWYHGAAVIDRADGYMHLYLDGYEESNISIASVGSLTTNLNFQLGALSREPAVSTFDGFFDGYLDELAVYSETALNATEVRTLYNYGIPNVPPPISYWTMDDDDVDSGTTLFDRMRRNDGTINGAVDGYVGQINESLFFDGVASYVDVGDAADLDFDTTDVLSIACWFKVPPGATQATILSKYSFPAGAAGWQLFLNPSGSMGFSFANIDFTAARFTETTSTAFRDDTWRHVVFTHDGVNNTSGMKIYMNGVSEALTSIVNLDPGSTLNSRSVFIAARDDASPDAFVPGNLDDIAVWNSELTQRQIEWIYAEGAKGRTLHTLCDPDGYQLSEATFALVNSTTAFNDFEDAIDMANADASGAFPLPTAYWSMDNSDLVGTTILDTIGGNNGTLTNTPTTGVVGQVQQTFTFALATSEFIDMGSVAALDWGSGDGSVGAWFNTSTNYTGVGIDGNIVANGATNVGGFRYHLHITDNSTNLLAFTIDDNTSLERVSSAVTVNDGNWHHGLGVREGANIKLYLDGALVDTQAIGAYGNLDDVNGFRIGAAYDTIVTGEDAFFDGEIDEAFVLTGQALTASQVFEIYSLGATNQKLVS